MKCHFGRLKDEECYVTKLAGAHCDLNTCLHCPPSIYRKWHIRECCAGNQARDKELSFRQITREIEQDAGQWADSPKIKFHEFELIQSEAAVTCASTYMKKLLMGLKILIWTVIWSGLLLPFQHSLVLELGVYCGKKKGINLSRGRQEDYRWTCYKRCFIRPFL